SNRRHFLNRLSVEISRQQRHGTPLALLALDLDFFKAINDRYGHQAGDEVLKALVATLRYILRPVDLIGRMGGEEFMVLLPEADAETAAAVAERIRSEVAAMDVAGGEAPLRVTVSIGIGQFGPDGDTAEAVFKAADSRLYGAKAGGRNRVVA
ncbi:MAG TPA: GGDEF domain-containing protein, partial [Azospira sp.]|nr:GGDEF domain-containing protein [Azospira sp.]